MQVLPAVVSLYVPLPHGLHGPPAAPKYPGTQRQAKFDMLDAGDDEFATQLLHIAAPDTALNVPAAQAVQAPPPFAPLDPAGHSHALISVAADAEVVLEFTHTVQVADPAVLFHDPAAHAEQLVAAPV